MYEETTQRVSRGTAVKLAAAGVAGAILAGTDSAEAAVGDPIKAGQTTDATSATTTLTAEDVSGGGGTQYVGDAFVVTRSGSTEGAAVSGSSTDNGSGVFGQTADQFGARVAGVVGMSQYGTGVLGGMGGFVEQPVVVSGTAGVANSLSQFECAGVSGAGGGKNAHGVYGWTNSAAGDRACAVYGTNQRDGTGIYGESNGGTGVEGNDVSTATTGNGVLGSSSAGTAVAAVTDTGTALYTQVNDLNGTALFADGRIAYRDCGRASINGTTTTPKSSVTVTPAALTTSSIVLATIQSASPGVYVASAVPHPATGKITITLSAPVNHKVTIGWFVVDLIAVVV
jgi:hypothetical protein